MIREKFKYCGERTTKRVARSRIGKLTMYIVKRKVSVTQKFPCGLSLPSLSPHTGFT